MPEMDDHVSNYPVSGKTGCPVIISKYSEAQKIKERMKLSIPDQIDNVVAFARCEIIFWLNKEYNADRGVLYRHTF